MPEEQTGPKAILPLDIFAPGPTEIKAHGLALACMGYSTRSVERELRRLYPGQKSPTTPPSAAGCTTPLCGGPSKPAGG